MQKLRQITACLALNLRIRLAGKAVKISRASLLFAVVFVLSLVIYTYTRAAHAPEAYAATSSTLNFQGRILNSAGGVVPDGNYNLEFKLYDGGTSGGPAGTGQANAGTLLWTEDYINTARVRVVNGYFNVNLGSQTTFPGTINWDQELWLTMNVGGSGGTASWDGEMLGPSSARTKLTGVPYAFRAGSAKQLLDNQGSFKGILSFLSLTADRTINLPDTDGTVLLDSTGFANGGNSFGATASIGTNDLNDLILKSNNTEGLRLDQSGNVSIGTGLDGLEKLDVNGGIKIGNTSGSNAGTLRWTGTDFEGYDGSGWVSLTGGGTTIIGSSSASFVSSAVNLAGTSTGVATGFTVATNTTTFSQTAGAQTFVAPQNGSFSSCLVIGNANRTAGTATLRWRVNGVSVGSGACVINAANPRTSTTNLPDGTVNFNAGDTIAVVFDSAGLTPAGSVEYTVYWSVNYSNSTGAGVYFTQGGNAFGATASLGTTDASGLNLITNGATRLSFSSSGDATFNNQATFNSSAIINSGLTVTGGATISSGGISVTGNSDINGTLSSLTGLSFASGSINLNGGDLANVANVSSASGLTLSSGVSSDLTISSGSGVVQLGADTLQRSASGSTAFNFNDNADTTLVIQNTDASAVANLDVEGVITANSFNGVGSGLVSLDAGNISTGTLNDSRLSSNVALLNSIQSFTARQDFNAGLVLGNTGYASAGALRWTGTDFEGFDGLSWVSLTSGSGGGSGNVTTVVKNADEVVNNSISLQDDDELSFPIGASEVWSFRFVVQANANTTPDLKFAVTAPSGAVCSVTYSDPEGATSNGQYGCGVSTARLATTTGQVDLYEITGTVTNGVNPGNVTLQWAQFQLEVSDATVYAGSYVNAFPQSIYIAPPSSVYTQGGNLFGATAILGTSDTNGLRLVTDGIARLIFTATGDAEFTGGATFDSSLLASAGMTVSGGTVVINDNVNNDTNINTANSTGVVTIGGGYATFSLDSTAFDVSSSGALSGISTLAASGAITASNSTDTINGLVINSGSLSNITGYTQTGGNFAQTGTGTFSTGTGGVNLNSATSLINSTTSPGLDISQTGDASALSITNNAITSGALVDIIHTTSGFSGTGLRMNIASGSGSFSTGKFLDLQVNGTSKLSVDNNGALNITTSSASGLKVSDTGGLSMLNVDTSGSIVSVGSSTADANGILLVLDSKTGTDPTGVNGGEYYNATSNKFRCYENGQWKNCLGYTAVRSFVDSTSDPVIDANTTNYWDTAAENNNSTPNIILSQSSGRSVMGMVTMEVTATSNTDLEVAARVERGIGAPPTCGSGTVVGASPGVFASNTGGSKASTVTFIDSPNTTSTVYYVLCSDNATVNTAGNVTRIRITLQEVENSN